VRKDIFTLIKKLEALIINQNDIQRFIKAIKDNSEYDFSNYAPKSFYRRVEKLLEDYETDIYDLIDKIYEGDAKFIQQIINHLTVNTTELFRDPKVWHAIRYRIFPKLKDKEKINIWHPGCSSGQEVYSMLILLNEAGLIDRTNVYGSDINTDMLEKAQRGEYSYRLNIEYFQNFDEVVRKNPHDYEDYKNVPYTKYFDLDPLNDIIRVKPFLKEKATFIKHDLVSLKNPFNKPFDLIVCRNVLIYFNRTLQNQVIHFFYDNLEYPGFLVLGYHESILGPESYNFHKHGYYYAKKLN